MRIIIITLALFSHVALALDLTSLQQRLHAQQNFSAELSQSKTLNGWNKPLQASGVMACTQEHGVLYFLQRPINASYWLQADQIQVREGSAPLRVMTTAQMPWLSGITQLFSASVSGDWARLQQQFNVVMVKSDDRDWRIELTPLAAPLNAALQSVQVSGGSQIEQIVITDKKGDRTQIVLQHHQRIDSAYMNALLQHAGQTASVTSSQGLR